MSLPDFLVILVTALSVSSLGLYFFGKTQSEEADCPDEVGTSDISLLFKGESLQHASAAGLKLANFNQQVNDWAELRANLSPRFPGFPAHPWDTQNTTILDAKNATDVAKLEIRKIDDSTHIQIIDQETLPLDVQHKIKTLEAEVLDNSFASSTAPHPIWKLDSNKTVVWHNPAYEELYQTVFSSVPQKDKPLFEVAGVAKNPLGSKRASVKSAEDDKNLWFDISVIEIDGGMMCHAIDINAVIHAEIAQRNFVQTLAKTFAQLSTGLAIFDRNQQLALFNPALVDLSSLPIEFLSTRPDLLSFFDRLRDNRVMPEPKNYHSWRQEIADVIAAATDGSYQETWSLDSGLTFRVSGRPHPDGAIAFLIEDISAEVSLARSFRAELAIGQSMMNTFDVGIAVFSSSGILQFCNSAYREMWKLDPENAFVDVTILDSIKDWQRESLPNPAWADIRDFVMKVGDRAEWDCQMSWKDQTKFECSVRPVALGATMLQFQRTSEQPSIEAEKPLLIAQ